MALIDKLTNIADAIREQTGDIGLLTLDNMAESIMDISGTNFSVVGGITQPATPQENTVWVNTDTEITSWAFSVAEPENKTEGMVWIATGTSQVVFDALKKNSIMVHPESAKQYISGAWVSKVIQLYQNGQWLDFWDGVALNPSNPNDQFTGGWTGDSNITPYRDTNRTFRAASASWTSSYARVSMPYKSEGSFRTKNKIDVTRFNTLTVTAGYTLCLNGMIHVFLTDKSSVAAATGGSASATIATSGDQVNNKTVTLDISKVTGEQYIGIGLANYATQASASNVQIDVAKITLT